MGSLYDYDICLENFKKLGNSKRGMLISAGLFNKVSFQRQGSQGKWYKLRFKKVNVGIGINVRMTQ